MKVVEHKALMHRYVEAVNQGDLDAFDEFFSDDFIDHGAPPDYPSGREGLKLFFTMFRSAFPDLQVTIDDLIAEGDKVVARFSFTGTHRGSLMDIPATGCHVTGKGIDICRIENGQVVELWDQIDMLGLLQQLGALPEAP